MKWYLFGQNDRTLNNFVYVFVWNVYQCIIKENNSRLTECLNTIRRDLNDINHIFYNGNTSQIQFQNQFFNKLKSHEPL